MGPETRVCGLAARDPGGGLAARAPIGDAVRSRRLSSQESEIGESEIGESEIGGGEEWPSRGVEYKLHAQPGHLVYYSRMRSLTGVGLETLPSKTVPGSCARLTALLLLLGTWFGCDHRPHDADTVESAVADPDTTSSINGATPLVPAVATPPVGYRTWQSVPIGTGFGSEADFHIEFARSHPFLAQWKRRVVLKHPIDPTPYSVFGPIPGAGFHSTSSVSTGLTPARHVWRFVIRTTNTSSICSEPCSTSQRPRPAERSSCQPSTKTIPIPVAEVACCQTTSARISTQ